MSRKKSMTPEQRAKFLEDQRKCYERGMAKVNALTLTRRESGRHGPRRDKTTPRPEVMHTCKDESDCDLCKLRGKNMTQIRLLINKKYKQE